MFTTENLFLTKNLLGISIGGVLGLSRVFLVTKFTISTSQTNSRFPQVPAFRLVGLAYLREGLSNTDFFFRSTRIERDS